MQHERLPGLVLYQGEVLGHGGGGPQALALLDILPGLKAGDSYGSQANTA
jgi:hypothetical protein